MAITTQLIGKLGRGGVESMTINQPDIEPGATATVTTIPIPQGASHTIVILVKTTGYTSTVSNSRPTLSLGGSSINLPKVPGDPAPYIAATSSNPIELKITRTNSTPSSYSAAFTGVAYWWPNK